MKYVIIGNSAAGVFAAEAVAKSDPSGEITIISKEKYPSYSRCLTTYLIAGEIDQSQVFIRPTAFFKKLPAAVMLGTAVVAVKPENRTVVLNNKKELKYDRLLIASGASPVRPNVPGVEAEGVFTLRTLDDAREIVRLALPGKRALILGGGLVSLKAAYALVKRGLEVYVLVTSPQVLSQMLDNEAAGLIQKRLEENGVKFGLNTGATKILTNKNGRVSGAVFDNGEEFPCDIVIVGKGVKPNTGFLTGTGIKVNRGIQVDEYMRSSVEGIYAAGDVAETYDLLLGERRVNATWPNAAEQGRTAGINMAGGCRKYSGSLAMNSVEFFGLSAISVGLTRVNGPDYQIYRDFKPNKNYYRKLVFQDNFLVGYTIVGDVAAAGTLTALIKYKIDVSNQKERLINEGRHLPRIFSLTAVKNTVCYRIHQRN